MRRERVCRNPLLCRFNRTIPIAAWVKEVKRVSSLWVKGRFPPLSEFAWQSGYGVFSVSQSAVRNTIEYIASQEAHHKKLSFQDEYRAFLTRHEVQWDERYVWD